MIRTREMSITDRPSSAAPSDEAVTGGIDAWLGILERLLHLPERGRVEIREELDSHLRERVRDLMLTGTSEPEAVQTAISELGEAAALARRLDHAHRSSRRRTIMHASILTLAAAGLVAGVVTIVPHAVTTTMTPPSIYEEPAVPAVAAPALLETRLPVQEEMTFEELVEMIRHGAGIGVVVEWEQLEYIGLGRDEPLGMFTDDLPIATILSFFSERTDDCGERLDWRLEGNLLRLDVRSNFDRRETVLVSYRVDSVLERMLDRYGMDYEQATEEVRDLVREMVESQAWMANGGDLAQMHLVGGTMFVSAPARLQSRVRWILDELHEGAGEADEAGQD